MRALLQVGEMTDESVVVDLVQGGEDVPALVFCFSQQVQEALAQVSCEESAQVIVVYLECVFERNKITSGPVNWQVFGHELREQNASVEVRERVSITLTCRHHGTDSHRCGGIYVQVGSRLGDSRDRVRNGVADADAMIGPRVPLKRPDV